MSLNIARESADRWSSGKLLSPLDGVPVVVKDQLFVKGLRTRNGCQNERSPADADSVAIQRLRDAGLIIIGISSMTQRGCSGLIFNKYLLIKSFYKIVLTVSQTEDVK